MDDLQAKLERANDMLNMLQNQRNAAQNECVALGAQLIAAQRRIQELKGDKPKTNGHDVEAAEIRPS